MHEFAVWAPKPERVCVDIDGSEFAMARGADGWWRATIDAAPDARYGYLLDDDAQLLPDPRSPRQPDGVHALSQLWEPAPQAWTDDGWAGRPVQGAVVYELHIGTFTPAGTFDAAIDKLDYLVGLGVDFVEVMPVNAFPATTAGATTACCGTRCTSRTADPTGWSASSTPAIAAGWEC